MKIFKSFTFWFMVLSVFVILQNLFGQDSKNLALIGLNPILNKLPLDFMNSGYAVRNHSIAGDISIYWYIASFITSIIYGVIFDSIKIIVHNRKEKRR